MIRFLRIAAAITFAFGALSGVRAQPPAAVFPDKAVRIVVPYTAGGATDAVARLLATKLSDKWRVPVIVDNKGGASGLIGLEAVARAPADGYTLFIADTGPYVILPALMPQMIYSPLTTLAPITVVARQIPVLVVSSRLPAAPKQIIEYLKSHPDTPYGSLGAGSYPNVTMVELQQKTGTRMLHVPYKGTSQVTTDLLGGQVDLYIGTLGAFQQHEKAGKLRIAAVATDKRVDLRPDLPTLAESGVPGFSVNLWFGLAAPAGTPADILDKVQRDVAGAVADKAFAEQMLVPGGDSRAAFSALVKADAARWAATIKRAGIKLDGS